MFPDPLFDLLLDLATSHGPESAAANDGSHLTAVACACLLSLVVVRGDTGKLLSATAALLMCPRALASQNIHVSFDHGYLDLFFNIGSYYVSLNKRVHNYKDRKNKRGTERMGHISFRSVLRGVITLSVSRVYNVEL
jgi:hypothetical protein